MAFDKETRNLLAKTVVACRHRLTEDVTDQLRGVFGLHPDGTVLPLGKMTHLTPDQTAAARHLRDLLYHCISGAAGMEKDWQRVSYERMVLEISFTILNRLAALRLCEERGLVVECVRKGTASDGFRLFERVSGGELGGRYETYRVFLECLFDQLALDLGALFDRLTKGEYGWAHMAYTIWPDRVHDICKKDRCIAIAHGLEDLCEIETPAKKKGGRGRKK